MLNLLVALAAAAQPAVEPDLDWLAGYWLSCENRTEVAELWISRRGGIMLGLTVTSGNDSFSWEQTRIEAGPSGLMFHAQPRGQSAASFRLLRSSGQEVVFENLEHDFPQRVIYRRAGDRLTGRIEGQVGGRAQASEWQYRSMPLNARCGAPVRAD